MRFKKTVVIIGICIILGLILANSLLSADTLKKFDLPGMLKEIDAKTKELGEINQEILFGLQQIDSKSAQTGNVGDRLKAVNEAAKNENLTLGGIKDVTGQQVTLSQEMNQLSRTLSDLMNAISGHSSTQSESSQDLLKTTMDARGQLSEVIQQNQLLEQKLEEAARKSEKAARSIP